MKIMGDTSISESYHGFNIEGGREEPQGYYEKWSFHASLNGQPQFVHSVRINVAGHEASQRLSRRGFNRVCGKIDLEQYQMREATEYLVDEDNSYAKNLLENKEIRLEILKVLNKIADIQDKHEFELFNVEGFCEILGIDKSSYLANAKYLRSKGCVADSPLQQNTIDKGGIYTKERK